MSVWGALAERYEVQPGEELPPRKLLALASGGIRRNIWMLYNAMACGSRYVTLIALWDGKAGEGAGGTKTW